METEVKISITNEELTGVRERLALLEAEKISGCSMEINSLYDFEDGRLMQAGCVLRVRRYEGSTILTFKGPTDPGSMYKKRRELETAVQDAAAIDDILKALGMSICFEYRKLRETYTVSVASSMTEVCIDQTPAGVFVEVEGEEPGIQAVLQKFGWTSERFVNKTYVEIYREHPEREP